MFKAPYVGPPKPRPRVAMELVRCQFRASIELSYNCTCWRVGRSSLIYREIVKQGDFSAVMKELSFCVRSSEIESVRARGSWRGRSGTSKKECSEYRELVEVRAIRSHGNEQSEESKEQLKLCVRCGMSYRDEDNSPAACKYHGHMTGDQGLYALAPPHQGIDGEWTDASGVIVYKWNNENERPSTGSKNWKRRWTCCGVYAEDAVPCQSGIHVSYDDGATRY